MDLQQIFDNTDFVHASGTKEEWIVLTAHYDTTSLSHGAYDNMSGCAGLLGIMEYMKDKERNYGLRFVFCGSEERGLLGSKAYVEDFSQRPPDNPRCQIGRAHV